MKERCVVLMFILLLCFSLTHKARAVETCLGFSWEPGVPVFLVSQDGPEGGCGFQQQYASWALNPYGGAITVSAKWPDKQGFGWDAPWLALGSSTGESWTEKLDPADSTIQDIVLGPKTVHYDFSAGCTAYSLTAWPFSCGWSGLGFCNATFNVHYPDPSVCGGQHKLSPDPELLGTPCENPHTRFDGGGPGCKASQGLPQYWVNTSFLSLVLEDTDFAYRSYGHNVALRRVWNMNSTVSGMFGKGWSFAYESGLHVKGFNVGDNVDVQLGTGQVVRYAVSEIQDGAPRTILHTRASSGIGPALSGYVDMVTGSGYYILHDKKDKISYRYEFNKINQTTGEFLYRLTSIADQNGNALALTYNGELLTTLTDASGRVTAFAYNAQNLCSEITTFHGKNAAYLYDSEGRMIQSSDLAGNISSFTYDERNNVLTMTAAGKTTSFAYAQATPPFGSAVWHLTKVTDPSGNETFYHYTDTWKTQVTEPGGGKMTYAHHRGRTAMVVNQLGQYTVKSYDSSTFLPSSVIDAQGRKTTYAYDANGNLTGLTEQGSVI